MPGSAKAPTIDFSHPGAGSQSSSVNATSGARATLQPTLRFTLAPGTRLRRNRSGSRAFQVSTSVAIAGSSPPTTMTSNATPT